MDGARQQHAAGAQRRHDTVEHRLEHRRHAGHHMDIADNKAGRDRDRVVDMGRAFRHARHALARGGELDAATGIEVAEEFHRRRIVVAGQAEGLGDGVGGDVVMGRADAAGGEDIGVAGPQRVDRLDDRRLVVADDADLLQVDADGGDDGGEMTGILLADTAGQDLVANDQRGGGNDRKILCIARLGGHAEAPDDQPVLGGREAIVKRGSVKEDAGARRVRFLPVDTRLHPVGRRAGDSKQPVKIYILKICCHSATTPICVENSVFFSMGWQARHFACEATFRK